MGANIFAQYIRPPRSVAEHRAALDQADLLQEQLANAQGSNALTRALLADKVQASQQQAAERSALQRIAGGWNGQTTATQRASDLLNSGRPGLATMADTILKSDLERQKTEAGVKETNSKTAKSDFDLRMEKANRAIGDIAALRDPQQAAASLQRSLQAGDIDQGKYDSIIGTIPQDPAQFPAWRKQMLMNVLDAKTQLELQGQEATRTETQRANQAREANAAGQLAVAQGNLGVAQGRLALDKEAPKGTYDPERGVIVDTRAGTARPVTMDGQQLQPKPGEKAKNEQLAINQQRSLIDEAIKAVQATPTAFGVKRGLATMAGSIPESVAGRFDSDEERQARSFVFNNVSAIINERAGAAQSAQELARLRAFLPAETDSGEQIVSKFNGFKRYLDAKEQGTTTVKPSEPTKPQGVPKVRTAGKVINFADLPP